MIETVRDHLHYIKGPTVSDVANATIKEILERGEEVLRTIGPWSMHKKVEKHPMRELHNITLVVENPEARWNTKVSEGMCEEVLDYLLGLNPGYVHFTKWSFYDSWREVSSGRYPYTYGERIYGNNGEFINQWQFCRDKLKRDLTTRHASVVIWRPVDHLREFIPCTFAFHIQVNDEGKLEWTSMMRSQDALRGLFLDLFAYTTFHQMMADELGVPMGNYTHFESNVHIYGKDIDKYMEWPVSSTRSGEVPKRNLALNDAQKRILFNAVKALYIDRKIGRTVDLIDGLPEYWRSYVAFQILDSQPQTQGWNGSALQQKLLSDLLPEMEWVLSVNKRIGS